MAAMLNTMAPGDDAAAARRRDGIERARLRGVRFGRKPTPLHPETAHLIVELYHAGRSYHDIANILNDRLISTRTGTGKWQATSIRRALKELGELR